MPRNRAVRHTAAPLSTAKEELARFQAVDVPEGTQSVKRALTIVHYLASLPEMGATIAEISKGLRLNRTTTHRIVNSLVEERFLEFHQRSGIFSVGPLPAELALSSIEDFRYGLAWENVIGEIARSTKQTTYLMARSREEYVCLKSVYGSAVVRLAPFKLGHRLPLGVGPSGVALLSQFSDKEIRLYVNRFFKTSAFARRHDYLDPEKMINDTIECKRRGYAMTRSHSSPEMFGIGVALPDREGEFLSMCIVLPQALLQKTSSDELYNSIQRSINNRRILKK